ncbi:MAG: IMP dehydrogenase [Nitrososphaerota archaeon]
MAKILEYVGLTFDDVLILPNRSSIVSRREVSTETELTEKIRLSIPIVSAAMDTVTESAMAISMARNGGIGVIHRFNTIDEQVEQVRRVKRAENIAIEEPYTISPEATVDEAEEMMGRHGVSGLLVVDHEKKLLGILTKRDILFRERSERVGRCMTPREKLVTAPPTIGPEEARTIFMKHKVEKLPLVDEAGHLMGLVTSLDLVKKTMYPSATRDSKGRLAVAAAIGVKDESISRAEALLEAQADALVIDVAHGHTESVIRMLRKLRSTYGDEVDIIAGNVATREGTEDLASAGASAVKVGVGPGSVCTTRVVAGVGVPQLTAIMMCSDAAERMGVPVIADGGVRSSADIVKALAAGASTVMVGRLLAGTDESPGSVIVRNGRKMKIYRGMASLFAMMSRENRHSGDSFQDALEYSYMAEGVEAYVPYKGSVSDVLSQVVAGLRSGLSYLGASNLKELREKTVFIRITEAGLRESKVHDVEQL